MGPAVGEIVAAETVVEPAVALAVVSAVASAVDSAAASAVESAMQYGSLGSGRQRSERFILVKMWEFHQSYM